MAVTRVRVTLRETGRPEADFKGMLSAFRKACSAYGIVSLHKKYEFYEKPSEKRAKKKKDQKLERKRARQLNSSSAKTKRR